MQYPSTCDCECNKAYKVDKHLGTRNGSYGKLLTVKLVLEYEDEMLNTNAASLYDKIETCEKSNCLIHTISLVIIYLLLLAVVSIGCCYYYTRDWIKKEHMLSY